MYYSDEFAVRSSRINSPDLIETVVVHVVFTTFELSFVFSSDCLTFHQSLALFYRSGRYDTIDVWLSAHSPRRRKD